MADGCIDDLMPDFCYEENYARKKRGEKKERCRDS